MSDLPENLPLELPLVQIPCLFFKAIATGQSPQDAFPALKMRAMSPLVRSCDHLLLPKVHCSLVDLGGSLSRHCGEILTPQLVSSPVMVVVLGRIAVVAEEGLVVGEEGLVVGEGGLVMGVVQVRVVQLLP